MSYLVRKINKRKNIDELRDIVDIKNVCADMPTGEFKTSNKGDLSTWYIESLENLDEAVLAIAVTSSKISKMEFIVIDTTVLDRSELKYKQTYAGVDIAIPDLQDTHYDIRELTLGKLENCCEVYKTVLQDDNGSEKYVVRYAEGTIRDLMRTAAKDGRVDISLAQGKIKEEFQKILNAI